MRTFGTVLAMAVWLGLPLPSLAQDAPQPITIALTSYAFTPQTLTLKANTPVTLHLVDNAGGGHSFSAPEFFAAASLADGSQVKDGTVELKGGESADVTLTPLKPGTYPLRCTHFLHASMGMTGSITVQ